MLYECIQQLEQLGCLTGTLKNAQSLRAQKTFDLNTHFISFIRLLYRDNPELLQQSSWFTVATNPFSLTVNQFGEQLSHVTVLPSIHATQLTEDYKKITNSQQQRQTEELTRIDFFCQQVDHNRYLIDLYRAYLQMTDYITTKLTTDSNKVSIVQVINVLIHEISRTKEALNDCSLFSFLNNARTTKNLFKLWINKLEQQLSDWSKQYLDITQSRMAEFLKSFEQQSPFTTQIIYTSHQDYKHYQQQKGDWLVLYQLISSYIPQAMRHQIRNIEQCIYKIEEQLVQHALIAISDFLISIETNSLPKEFIHTIEQSDAWSHLPQNYQAPWHPVFDLIAQTSTLSSVQQAQRLCQNLTQLLSSKEAKAQLEKSLQHIAESIILPRVTNSQSANYFFSKARLPDTRIELFLSQNEMAAETARVCLLTMLKTPARALNQAFTLLINQHTIVMDQQLIIAYTRRVVQTYRENNHELWIAFKSAVTTYLDNYQGHESYYAPFFYTLDEPSLNTDYAKKRFQWLACKGHWTDILSEPLFKHLTLEQNTCDAILSEAISPVSQRDPWNHALHEVATQFCSNALLEIIYFQCDQDIHLLITDYLNQPKENTLSNITQLLQKIELYYPATATGQEQLNTLLENRVYSQPWCTITLKLFTCLGIDELLQSYNLRWLSTLLNDQDFATHHHYDNPHDGDEISLLMHFGDLDSLTRCIVDFVETTEQQLAEHSNTTINVPGLHWLYHYTDSYTPYEPLAVLKPRLVAIDNCLETAIAQKMSAQTLLQQLNDADTPEATNSIITKLDSQIEFALNYQGAFIQKVYDQLAITLDAIIFHTSRKADEASNPLRSPYLISEQTIQRVIAQINQQSTRPLENALLYETLVTYLFKAAEAGSELSVALIHHWGIPLDATAHHIRRGPQVIHQAAYSGHWQLINYLRNVNTEQCDILFQRSFDDSTALHSAAANNQVFVIEKLLEWVTPDRKMELLCTYNQASTVSTQPHMTALHIAAGRGALESMTLLLQQDDQRKLINSVDSSATTALHHAIQSGGVERSEHATQQRLARVKLLIENQADINHPNRYGQTPLHLAVAKNDVTLIQYLLAHGAKTNLTDEHDRTPLELANLLKKQAIITVLKPVTAPRIIQLDTATKPLPKKEEDIECESNLPDSELSKSMTHEI